ncbi:MAG: phosphotriesterase family protein [Thermomicrobiales bacterium]
MREQMWDFGLDRGQAFEPDEDEDVSCDRSMPHVMTALGPVEPDDLGVTLHHEHVIARPSGDDHDLVLDDPHRVLSDLEEYYLAGGRTIVDMSTADCGRDASAVAWLAARSPINVVVATGHHNDLSAAPFLRERTAEKIAAGAVAEIRTGIGNTGVCAGVITAGTSFDQITAVEERVLRAAAWAQLETGAPISTFTAAGRMALEQLAILREEGAEASHVIVGQFDRDLDRPYLVRVLETGAFVSFDQIGSTHLGRDEERAAMIKQLVDDGYSDHLLFSGDLARKSTQSAYGGAPGWTYVMAGFPLMLMELGLGAEDVRQLMVENPARALTTRPPSRHIP